MYMRRSIGLNKGCHKFLNISGAPLSESKYICISCGKCKTHSALLFYWCVFKHFILASH
jgi:hypothetical protein